jgi:hypothetical protein
MEPLASIRSDGSQIFSFSKELSQELANCHGETYIQKKKAKEEIDGKEIIKWIKPEATK